MLQHTFDKLDAIERVRVHLKDVVGAKISVPGIVVVGSQSSGKSSVLEHATGLAFPRGEGTCTRVPTVVSVESVPDTESTSITVATDPTYETDRHDLAVEDDTGFGDAIRTLTDTLAPNNIITDAPIYVKYKRHGDGPTFTLTDVPGITFKDITSGQDIEATTTNLTRKMVSQNEDTLILVVLPATEDFGNSKALKIAEQEDPEGRRTIGVVTKVDNLPPASKLASAMADDSVHPLRHGYYAVRNRTQQEIEDGMDLEDLAEAETNLFATDPVLSTLPEESRGMPRLLEKICTEQERAVDASIPKLRRDVAERLGSQQRELEALPAALVSEQQRAQFIATKLATLGAMLRRCAEADTSVLGATNRTTNLSARVHEALQQMAHRAHEDMPDFLSKSGHDNLEKDCKEARGYNLSTFMEASVFRETFSKDVVSMLSVTAERATASVRARLEECMTALIADVIPQSVVTPKLKGALQALVEEELRKNAKCVRASIDTLNKAEACTTFTTNHYYTQTIDKFKQIVGHNSGNWKRGALSSGVSDGGDLVPKDFLEHVAQWYHNNDSNEKRAVFEMQLCLAAFAKVVRKRYVDTVGILIISGMITKLKDDLPALSAEWAPKLVESIVEDKHAVVKRKALTRSIAGLTEAAAVLDRIA